MFSAKAHNISLHKIVKNVIDVHTLIANIVMLMIVVANVLQVIRNQIVKGIFAINVTFKIV